MKKKLVSVLLATAMVFSLVACGGTQEESVATDSVATTEESTEEATEEVATSSEEQIVIQVFSGQPDRTTGQGMVEQMIFDNYMAENPNVVIEVEALDDENYKTKFKAYASGTNMPDLVNVWGQPGFLDEVIDAGLIAELNPDDYVDYNFVEGSLGGFSKDGKLYGLPRNTDVMGFFYNKAIFDECGVEIPTTYDEYLAACKTIKENGYIPVAFDGADGWPMTIYVNDVYQKLTGVESYDKSLNSVLTGDYSDPNWTKAMELTMDAVDAGAFQAGYETTDYGTSLNLFTNGQSAMYYMGSWEMSMATNENISEEIRENIGAFAMPAVDGGAGAATDIRAWNGGGFSVTANSDVKEEAIKLLNYMMEPDNYFSRRVLPKTNRYYDKIVGSI
ncbi:MAG: extracellular solute-binding protein [Eubacteriales bacterium]